MVYPQFYTLHFTFYIRKARRGSGRQVGSSDEGRAAPFVILSGAEQSEAQSKDLIRPPTVAPAMRSLAVGSARGRVLTAAHTGRRSLPPRLRRFVHKNLGLRPAIFREGFGRIYK